MNSRTFISSTSSSRDDPKRFIKEEELDPQASESIRELEPAAYFDSMASRHRQLEKDMVQQVRIPAHSSTLNSDEDVARVCDRIRVTVSD